MVTVDPADQLRLLEVQAIDTRLDQVAHTRATLPESARAAELEALLSTLRDDIVLLRTKISDIDRELHRAENDVQAVRSRADRDRARLESGQGSAKDLLGMQHELESLARRQAELEDTELEVMERREEQASLLATAEARMATTTAELEQVARVRDERFAALDSQRDELDSDRAAAAVGIPESVTKVYLRLRDRLGNGAAPLVHGRCEGCRMSLSPSDLHTISERPASELLRCPECERILVRVPEPQQ